VTLGHLATQQLDKALANLSLLVVVYGGYLLAISFWREVFPLQIVGVCLSLAIIYRVGQSLSLDGGFVPSVIVLLGQYSLFAYIAQIAILQVLRRVWPLHGVVGTTAALIAASILTAVAVKGVQVARQFAPLNRLYGAVFS
jgi:hypothetical protein